MQLQFDPRTEQLWLGFYDRARTSAWWKGFVCGLCAAGALALAVARPELSAKQPVPHRGTGAIGEAYSHTAEDEPSATPPAKPGPQPRHPPPCHPPPCQAWKPP